MIERTENLSFVMPEGLRALLLGYIDGAGNKKQ
jgi:hypothetical protein